MYTKKEIQNVEILIMIKNSSASIILKLKTVKTTKTQLICMYVIFLNQNV